MALSVVSRTVRNALGLCPTASVVSGVTALSSVSVVFGRGMRRSTRHRDERIVCNEDGSVIVAWHPEPKFPYEFTRPIPRTEVKGTDSLLKVQAVEDMRELYHHKPKRLQTRDLMRLTWTTRKRWHPAYTENMKDEKRHHPKERPFM